MSDIEIAAEAPRHIHLGQGSNMLMVTVEITISCASLP